MFHSDLHRINFAFDAFMLLKVKKKLHELYRPYCVSKRHPALRIKPLFTHPSTLLRPRYNPLDTTRKYAAGCRSPHRKYISTGVCSSSSL